MEKAKFEINPHVIRQLGAELVSDQVTALMELIKNSYDADATYVKVLIDTTGECQVHDLYNPSHAGYILVEDDGFGMDRETLLKSWLTISYSNKRAVDGVKPKTPSGRTPLGDKGLGRLSTQRLANCCEIYTKKSDSLPFHVGFRWSDFDEIDKLSEVNVDFQPADFKGRHGTQMYLLDLYDAEFWRGDGLERLKGSLCQMIAPYTELRPFNVYLFVNGEPVDIQQEIAKLDKLNLCDINFQYRNGVMSGRIDIRLRKLIGQDYPSYEKYILADNGKRFEEYLFNDKKKRGRRLRNSDNGYWLSSEFSFNLDSILKTATLFNEQENDDPGDFEGRIQEFSLGNQQDEQTWTDYYDSFKSYKGFIQAQTGIKLYRNGFAIKPYGLDNNDWLALGQAQTGGSSYYGLRPGNVIGYVAIDESANKNLRDKTDREGLIDNVYYRNFLGLIKNVIRQYTEVVESLRRCYADFRKSLTDKNTKVQTLSQALRAIQDLACIGAETSGDFDAVQTKFKNIEAKIGKVIAAGDSDSVFGCSDDLLKKTLQEVMRIHEESKNVLAKANIVLRTSKELDEALRIIESKLTTLNMQLNDFSELAALGLVSEMITHDLGQISHRLLSKGNELNNMISSGKEVSQLQLYSIVDFIRSTVTSLQNQMKHLDPSLKYNKEKVDVFSIEQMLREEELPYYVPKLKNKGIAVNLNAENDFSIKMNKGKLMQVFDNLINNSIFWLERVKPQDTPSITIKIDKPWIYIEDNGIGIDKSVEDILFEPFITRKPIGEGRGLGLFIVRQLLDNYRCDIILDEQRNSYGNRYRFSLNMNEVIAE